MRYNGQLHRTPRYSRVPARDDHGAPRCAGRDGRMRPRMQRVFGCVGRRCRTPCAGACGACDARRFFYVRHARRKRPMLLDEERAARASLHAPERRPPTATAVPCRAVPRGICNIRGCRQPKTEFFCYYFSSRSKIVIFILEFSLQNRVIS